jgi:predicted transposase YbfD/YdcC
MDTGWSKEHGRLERCRLQRVAIDPQSAGLCGCWQFVAVWRERQKCRNGRVVETSAEYAYYATSLCREEKTAQELYQIIRGHWAACENGAHYRRDVTLGEDACLIAKKTGAFVMATLRNLVLGLFELDKHRGRTKEAFLPGWLRAMTQSQALKLLQRD